MESTVLDIGTKRLEFGPSSQSSLMFHGGNRDTQQACAQGRLVRAECGSGCRGILLEDFSYDLKGPL